MLWIPKGIPLFLRDCCVGVPDSNPKPPGPKSPIYQLSTLQISKPLTDISIPVCRPLKILQTEKRTMVSSWIHTLQDSELKLCSQLSSGQLMIGWYWYSYLMVDDWLMNRHLQSSKIGFAGKNLPHTGWQLNLFRRKVLYMLGSVYVHCLTSFVVQSLWFFCKHLGAPGLTPGTDVCQGL